MSLSKQLYTIISFIFLMIFAGNFIISVQNTKDYLELESQTKAQDTATSLGMTLKNLISDKTDPEIESTIKAISNRGFYKEIRLEDTQMHFSSKQLIEGSKDIDQTIEWTLTEVSIDPKYGTVQKVGEDDELSSALEALEDQKLDNDIFDEKVTQYTFSPSQAYINGGNIPVSFTANFQNDSMTSQATLLLNKVLVKESREEKFDYVPQWFIDLFPLDMQEQKSEISDGWNIAAVIYVSANAGDAYAKLFEQAKSAIIYAVVAFAISIAILVFFLQLILQPLKMIEKLAMNIAKGQFSIIEKLPYTTEVRNVAIAMNDMSRKIEGIIKKLNTNIDSMSKKISTDELTNLNLRQTFETDVKKMFIAKGAGYVLSVKISNLGEFAKNNNNDKVDKFIQSFAKTLKDTNEGFNFEVSAYRFFGSEFAMIIKDCNSEEITKITAYLKEKFDQLGADFDKGEVAHIGATPFNPYSTLNDMLNAANESCEMAKQVGPNEASIRDENDLARDMDLWRELIFDIIDNSKFNVGYINDAYVLNGEDEGKLIMQEAFTSAKDNEGEDIPIGTFVSIAERYDRVIDFDKAVVQKVVDTIKAQSITHNISINLSLDSIESVAFLSWIEELLVENESIAKQLVFSITSYAVAKDIGAFKHFARIIQNSGGRIIVKRFESKFISLEQIKDLNLDFIRLARDYTNGIHKDSGKQGFVESMQEVANLLNITILAENVKSDEDLNKVKQIEIYAASR